MVKSILMVFGVSWILWEVEGADSREIKIHSANISTKMLHICTEDLPCELSSLMCLCWFVLTSVRGEGHQPGWLLSLLVQHFTPQPGSEHQFTALGEHIVCA